MKTKRLAYAAATGWLVFVTILMVIPGSAIPGQNWFGNFPIDKCVHILLFAILVILWARTMGKKYPTKKAAFLNLCLLGIAGLGYGFAMEIVQRYFVSNRSYDNRDIIADGVGCAIGILYAFRKYIKK